MRQITWVWLGRDQCSISSLGFNLLNLLPSVSGFPSGLVAQRGVFDGRMLAKSTSLGCRGAWDLSLQGT